jgi:hypothetical protein
MLCLGCPGVMGHDGPNGPLRLALDDSTQEVYKKNPLSQRDLHSRDATSTHPRCRRLWRGPRQPLQHAPVPSWRHPSSPLDLLSLLLLLHCPTRLTARAPPLLFLRPRSGHPRLPRACSCPMTPHAALLQEEHVASVYFKCFRCFRGML